MGLSQWAAEESERLLAPLGRRWTHSQAVAKRAGAVADVVAEDRDVLVAAAYLHDVGYAAPLVLVGFHPLDGACWLADRGHDRLAGLVANHSGSKHEAELRGLSGELARFPDERSAVTAALAYCDLTTGPDGESMTPEERLADVQARHGQDSLVALGLRRAWPELMVAVATTEERLRQGRAIQPM
jgi:HD superfamily phosphodiesterase